MGNQKTAKKNGGKKRKIPALKLKYRILLYTAASLFAALSLMQAAAEILPYLAGIGVYVFAATSLFAACVYLVNDVRMAVRKIRQTANRLAGKNELTGWMLADYRLRTVIFAAGGLPVNMAFAAFNGVVGVMSRSAWYITLAFYYLILGMMRFWSVNYERRVSKRKRTQALRQKEIRVYRNNSILLILMTAVLGGMVILTLRSMGGKHYSGLTIYVAALYTFIKVPRAMIGRVKSGKMQSPLLVAIRNIGYADACVSVLSLQTAMLVSFGDGEESFRMLMNEITGAAVCLMVLGMGIYGVCSARNMQKRLETEGETWPGYW